MNTLRFNHFINQLQQKQNAISTIRICKRHSQSNILLRSIIEDKNISYLTKFLSTSIRRNSSVQLAYKSFEVQGSSNPPLLILHGLFGGKSNWRSLAKTISQRSDSTVHTLDLRNHGDSPHAEEFDYPTMVLDVERFLDDHAIPHCIMMGHSMGGRVAMGLALKQTKKVRKLVVVDVSPLGMPRQTSEEMPKYMVAMMSAMKALPSDTASLAGAKQAINLSLKPLIPEEAIRQFLLTNITEDGRGGFRWKINLPVLMDKFSQGAIHKSVDGIAQPYPNPALFIYGGKSPYIKAGDIPKIQEIFPNSEFREISSAGHWVHADRPQEFLDALCPFLKPS